MFDALRKYLVRWYVAGGVVVGWHAQVTIQITLSEIYIGDEVFMLGTTIVPCSMPCSTYFRYSMLFENKVS